ncbi:MAG: hypothetical protein V1917_03265 [Candidatus Gottesmanbacteria bacterium]
MQILSSVGSVVGNNSSVHWAQTIKNPHVYGIIEAIDAASIAQTIGMQAISKITQRANRSVVSLRDLEEVADEGMHEGIRSIALIVPVGTTLYVVVRGSGMVYLKRNGQYARLLDHEGSISGEGKEGDVVLLVSDACKNTVSESEMMGIFDHLSAVEAAEKFALLLNGKTDSAGCVALLFEVMKHVPYESVQQPVIDPTHAGKIGRFLRARPQDKAQTIKRHALVWGRRLKNPKVSVTMLLIVLFVASVLFGINKEFSMKSDQQVTSVMKETERVYEEGMALMELNPVKGRERLAAAKTLLAPIKEIITSKTKDGRRVLELFGQIEDSLTQAMHAYTDEPTLFYDAALLKSGGTITYMAAAEDMIILGDTKEKAVYSLAIPGKTGQIVAGGSGYEMTQAVAIRGGVGYALLSEGINEISLDDKKAKQNVIKKSNDWGRIAPMVSFGGNIYLLDVEKGRIWKYVATETGFSDIREYLNPDTLPDLSKATSMAIDGSVWIGTTDGKIIRFTQGRENTFVPKGVDPAFGSQLIVYTSDIVNNVYVLDVQNKRVVVLDKDGIYLSQYSWKSDSVPTNLVVSEKHGKIFLLAGGAIYSIDLK